MDRAAQCCERNFLRFCFLHRAEASDLPWWQIQLDVYVSALKRPHKYR